MITVTVLYPNQPGSQFDMDYYCATHMPLCRKLLGSALKGVTVEKGLGGAAPGSAPTYAAIGQLRFDSLESFQKAFGPVAQEIQNDIPKYTNVQPIIQISEVKMS